MDVIYPLKRRWGTKVTLYAITGMTLDLDSGKKVLTKVSKVVARVVFLPSKQARIILKNQAAFEPHDAVVLVDKYDIHDFGIKLDDYIIKSDNNRYVIVGIEDHPHFYVLKVKSVSRSFEPLIISQSLSFEQSVSRTKSILSHLSATDSLVLSQIAAKASIRNLSASDSLILSQIATKIRAKIRSANDSLVLNQLVAKMLIKNPSVSDSLVLNQLAAETSTRNLSVSDSLILNQLAAETLTRNLSISDSLILSQLATGTIAPYSNLLASWKLDETSGTRYDNYGSYDLTDNNTVGYAAGKLGNAASFVGANNESLSLTPSFDPQDTDFTIAGWFRPRESEAALVRELSDHGTSYQMRVKSTPLSFHLNVWSPSYANSDLYYAALTPSLNTWYWICFWHNAGANQIGLRINNSGDETMAHANDGVNTGANPRMFWSANSPSVCYDSDIDAVQCWSRLLTTAEKDIVYNNGTGVEL